VFLEWNNIYYGEAELKKATSEKNHRYRYLVYDPIVVQMPSFNENLDESDAAKPNIL